MPLWKEIGPDEDIVVSSRIRLARNLSGINFPGMMTDSDCEKVTSLICDSKPEGFGLVRMGQISDIARSALVEEHIISPNLATRSEAALLINEDETLSVMINEEDHLRIQCLLPGMQLDRAMDLANDLDDKLSEKLKYAYHAGLGYLTSCPTNVGTGLRASLMLHLPALTMTGQMPAIIKGISKTGMTVRGIYGEGSECAGAMYQISNQITLGHSEKEIVMSISGTASRVMDKERKTRQLILDNARIKLEDKVFRSCGILKTARTLDSKEMTELVSNVKLGVAAGIVSGVSHSELHNLLMEAQPAFIQQKSGRDMTEEERDIKRAEMVRSIMKDAE
ncbi:MAG: protein arginine kinase [Christensenellales bacterium]|jgi:protein arginine kinase